MKTLIASIYYPEKAKGFIEYSIRLADYLKSKLILLYVEEPNPYPVGAADISGWVNAEIHKSFEQRASRVKEGLHQFIDEVQHVSGVKVPISLSLEKGKETMVLQHMTASDPASHMVIVENQDKEILWIKNGKISSLVSSLNCPVWVIPDSNRFAPFEQVVYATDYNKEDIPLLKQLNEMMDASNPRITALHVTDDLDFDEKIRQAGFKEMLRSKTSSDRITLETLIENEGENLATAINTYCHTFGTDLIVVMQENAGFLERMFVESKAIKLMKQLKIPMLVYHCG